MISHLSLHAACVSLSCGQFRLVHAGSISGDNMDIPKVPHDLLRPIQSTAPAAPWLFPTPDIWQDQVVVETQGGDQYTTKDIEQMLQDLHLQQQVSYFQALLHDEVHVVRLRGGGGGGGWSSCRTSFRQNGASLI